MNGLHQACIPATHRDGYVAKLELAKQFVPDADLFALWLFMQQNDVLPFIGDSSAFHFAQKLIDRRCVVIVEPFDHLVVLERVAFGEL